MVCVASPACPQSLLCINAAWEIYDWLVFDWNTEHLKENVLFTMTRLVGLHSMDVAVNQRQVGPALDVLQLAASPPSNLTEHRPALL